MDKINFTIIIPHKNTPVLLAKCLQSIPEREDVQVIIVDDNSNPSIVDFGNFPGVNRKNTIVVFDKSGKGAGNARNVALDQIKDTKWLIFSDSDDYFTPYLNEAMDKYVDTDYDLVFFKRHSVYVGTDKPATRHQKPNARVDEAIMTNDNSTLRYKDLAPVCKFVAYKNVKEKNIRFEAIPVSNDAMFFLKVGINSNNIKVDSNPIYVVTESENSLMKQYSVDAFICRYNASVRVTRLLRKYNVEKFHPNLFAYLYAFSKLGKGLVFRYFFLSLAYTPIKYWAKDLYACYKAFMQGGNKIV